MVEGREGGEGGGRRDEGGDREGKTAKFKG
jgi:hypothetical protein